MKRITITNLPIGNGKNIVANVNGSNTQIELTNVEQLIPERNFQIIGNDMNCTIVASCSFRYFTPMLEQTIAYYICNSADGNYWLLKPENQNEFLR